MKPKKMFCCRKCIVELEAGLTPVRRIDERYEVGKCPFCNKKEKLMIIEIGDFDGE